MKNVLLTLISLFAINASATSPAAIPDQALAVLRVGGGMPAPGGLRFRQVVIRQDGEVRVKEVFNSKDFNNNRDVRENEYVAGVVPATELADLKSTAAHLRIGAFKKVSDMGCMDAPSYSYLIERNGVLIEIFANVSCQDRELRDRRQRASARLIKNYLDQWNRR